METEAPTGAVRLIARQIPPHNVRRLFTCGLEGDGCPRGPLGEALLVHVGHYLGGLFTEEDALGRGFSVDNLEDGGAEADRLGAGARAAWLESDQSQTFGQNLDDTMSAFSLSYVIVPSGRTTDRHYS